MFSEITSHASLILTLLAIGGAGGFLSGLLGVGGGIIFVPALYFTLVSFVPNTGDLMRVAVGTSLALILATGTSSAYWHHKKGSVDFTVLKSWAPAAVGGVAIGTVFASAVDSDFLKHLFICVMLVISIYMAVSKEQATEAPAHRIRPAGQRLFASFVGLLSAMTGVGGAGMSIPFMAYMGMPMRKAVGTGGALACIISLPAMASYIVSGLQNTQPLPPYCIGYVNWLALAVILPASMLLSPVGVHISHKLPRNILRRIFAGVTVIVAVRMIMS